MDRTGRNTADAFTDLGYPADSRTFTHGLEILRDLKISQVKLITNNPNKIENLSEFEIEVVKRVPLVAHHGTNLVEYLRSKKETFGHNIDIL